MPNPFPGMDPYIEARGRWPDFHHEFISQCRAAINARLPSDYVATINERLQTIELAEPTHRVALPDVSVIHDPAVTSSTTGKAARARRFWNRTPCRKPWNGSMSPPKVSSRSIICPNTVW